MEQRSREQGFTIVELMVVVAIIAVLAAIAIPAFTRESKKSKAASEVSAMFAELSVREEQYKTENNAYLEAAACPSGTPSAATRDAAGCLAANQPWETLRVKVSGISNKSTDKSTFLFCTYEVTTNTSSSTAAPSWVTFAAPAISWYFIVATCDLDSDGKTSQYFTSSVDSRIQKHNDGD